MRSLYELTSPVDVWLRSVHAESELVENTEVSRAWRGGHARLGIVDQERVLLSEKRCLATWSVLGVPDNLGLLCGHVDCDGVGSLVCRARCENVDGGGCHRQRGVVPCEGHVVAHPVELVSSKSVGSDHGDSSSG